MTVGWVLFLIIIAFVAGAWTAVWALDKIVHM